MAKLSKKQAVEKLLAIYDAIGGMVSECGDPFDGFYKPAPGKTSTGTMCEDFESALAAFGVVFKNPEYVPASYKECEVVKWGVLSDPDDPKSWVIMGLDSKDDAEDCIREFCAA